MKIYFVCVAVFFCASCSKSSSSNSGGQSVLEGTWTGACVGEGNGSAKKVAVFSGSSQKQTAINYSSNDCSTGTEKSSIRFESTFSVGSAATTPEGATKLDESKIRVFVTPKNDNEVSEYNRESYFGFNDWSKNKEKEVTGKTLDGAEDSLTRNYTIFKITGNTLCMGTSDGDNDGSSDAKRERILESGGDCLKR